MTCPFSLRVQYYVHSVPKSGGSVIHSKPAISLLTSTFAPSSSSKSECAEKNESSSLSSSLEKN